jgi:hypothetical protein
MSESTDKAAAQDIQFAALAASATIMTFFVVYWIVQIIDVREMLTLAYG